jgi:hypothetical protein
MMTHENLLIMETYGLGKKRKEKKSVIEMTYGLWLVSISTLGNHNYNLITKSFSALTCFIYQNNLSLVYQI